jgi:hypothetical protein
MPRYWCICFGLLLVTENNENNSGKNIKIATHPLEFTTTTFKKKLHYTLCTIII